MNQDKENGKSVTAQSYPELETEELAQEVFEKVKQRMLHVNTWQEFAGEAMTHFNLTDEQGNELDGPAREGLFFRIDIPGPGSKDGTGFDWVRVEKIEESSEEQAPSLGIRVRPSSNPATTDDDIVHFYSDESTSTFHVKREGAIVTTSVVDRNLKPNTDAHGIDEIRNRLVGLTGIIGASKIQWKSLTDGLLSGLE